MAINAKKPLKMAKMCTVSRLERQLHVFLNRVQQTVSGNKPSQCPPDTIRWTLFRLAF